MEYNPRRATPAHIIENRLGAEVQNIHFEDKKHKKEASFSHH